ncbi:signal peptidase I [Mediterraneibacter faecis]|uniref:signal peptidase I n=1 Tax=Fusicatenibacter saccharivorans TaxID=1150298 RepID=UPI00303BA535|nr:signal peptidase I [Fusicatenibacter saccharivorans]
MIQKIILHLVNLVSVITIAAAVVVLCIVLLTRPGEAPSIAGYTLFRITTGSMEPTYPVDTLILVKKTDPSRIQTGDVISFYSSDPALDGAVNTHRVTGVRTDGTHWSYKTKGDANNVEDAYGTSETALIGKVTGSSLLLGKLARLIVNPLLFIPVILIPLAAMLVGNTIKTVKLAKQIAEDEEKKAIEEALQEIRKEKRNNR